MGAKPPANHQLNVSDAIAKRQRQLLRANRGPRRDPNPVTNPLSQPLSETSARQHINCEPSAHQSASRSPRARNGKRPGPAASANPLRAQLRSSLEPPPRPGVQAGWIPIAIRSAANLGPHQEGPNRPSTVCDSATTTPHQHTRLSKLWSLAGFSRDADSQLLRCWPSTGCRARSGFGACAFALVIERFAAAPLCATLALVSPASARGRFPRFPLLHALVSLTQTPSRFALDLRLGTG